MFDLNRRIGRLNNLLGILLSFVVMFIATVVAMLAIDYLGDLIVLKITVLLLLFAVLIAGFIYNVCLIKQRSNDISNDNAVLITILAFLSGLSFILLVIPGQKKTNRYGPVPTRVTLP